MFHYVPYILTILTIYPPAVIPRVVSRNCHYLKHWNTGSTHKTAVTKLTWPWPRSKMLTFSYTTKMVSTVKVTTY
jgi:hypothetical protein